MEKNHYFKTSNPLNAAINIFAGSDFPMSDNDEVQSLMKRIWIKLVWVIKVAYLSTGFVGSCYFADQTYEEIFKKNGPLLMLTLESCIPTIYLYYRRDNLHKLIRKYNLVFRDSEDLRRFIKETVQPYVRGLKICIIATVVSGVLWGIAPIFYLFEADSFTYANFNVPAYFPGEPFGPGSFLAGTIFQFFACFTLDFSKISVDLYVIHLIATLTAHFKYVGEQISRTLSEENSQNERTIVAALSECVRHHSAIIGVKMKIFLSSIGQTLGKLLAFLIAVTYIMCILKFCFAAFAVITFRGASVEKFAYLVYIFICIVQVFTLCSSIQELEEQSTSVTEDAFHENWHARGKHVKKIFCTIELTNQMECRLSAWRVVDLVVPTLALILNKSYSICLLLLRVN